MSLRRTPAGPGARSTSFRPEMLCLDERIVPDVTSPTVPGTVTVTPGVTGTVTNPIPTTTTTSTATTVGDTTTTTTTTTTDTPVLPPIQRYAVGSDAGNGARVRVYDNTGAKLFDFNAYPRDAFRGGVRVATGDLNGDGVEDLITAPGSGRSPLIQIFDGDSGEKIASFNAFVPYFTGGAYVATGDVNGDGRADLVVGAGDTGGSHVKIYDGKLMFPSPTELSVDAPGSDATLISQYFAYNAAYRVGARVAVGDVNADGKADVITGAGNLGGPHVRVFSGADGTILREFYAYDPLFNGGVFVAAGDLNADGKAEVITGMGTNGNARVNIYDGNTGRQSRSFLAITNANRGSVRVGVMDIDRDGDNDVVTLVRNDLKAYDGKAYTQTAGMQPFDDGHLGAVFFG